MPRAKAKPTGHRIERKGDTFIYSDGSVAFAAKDRPRETPSSVPIEIPVEKVSVGGEPTIVLRPWRMWVGEDEYWRPRYDKLLTPRKRRQICERIAAWLEARRHKARIVEALPDAKSPLHLAHVDIAAMKTLLEYLLCSGLRLPGTKPANALYPGASDPMEVFRGPGAPRKWYYTQGGELNVHVVGKIPVKQVESAFVLPNTAKAAITVSARAISGAGDEIWEATIWAEPA